MPTKIKAEMYAYLNLWYWLKFKQNFMHQIP